MRLLRIDHQKKFRVSDHEFQKFGALAPRRKCEIAN